MMIRKSHIIALIAVLLIITTTALAHPTGNMISVGKNVLWAYINPIDDPDHHACIMIWRKNSEPAIFMQSDFPASDYMLYNHQNDIYIIERRHVETRQEFEIRILKTTIEGKPKVIWPWFKDEWRIGEGGFVMISDDQLVFSRYPKIYSLRRGDEPIRFFDFKPPVKRIRATGENQLLLLGDVACYLVNPDGTILKQWNNLIDKNVKDAPLNRNQLFDADYRGGELLLAYCGNRSFDVVDENGKRNTIVKLVEPLTPHWVAFFGDDMLLFSSEMGFDGSTPKPHLLLFNNQNGKKLIWGKL